jgi:hypothetical protein
MQEAGGTSKGSLVLFIELEKQVYRQGESIHVEGILHNTSPTPLVVQNRFAFPGPDVYLEIKEQSGKTTLKWLPPEPPISLNKADFVRLGSKEKVSFTLRDIQIHVYKGLTEGTYTLRGIYKNQSGEELGLDVWEGKVYSDEVNFQVVK